ncbi:MAG: metal-sensitive transcriptional regulator [Candidatus Peregrinibacteria bacterium]
MNEQTLQKRQGNAKAQKAVNGAAGSLKNVVIMLQDGRYCPEIIQQIDSVIGLLKSARTELLRGHLDSCLVEQIKNDKDGAVRELLKIYKMQ